MAANPLIVIVGETASGKSGLAMELAQQYQGEIISADSWTVYPKFNIGTAKPTAQERAKIKHHLLDVADPKQGFNAALYKKLALQSIEQIRGQKHLPIMVGGTGLYIDAVLYDFEFLPTSPERSELDKLDLEELLKTAKQRLIDLAGIDVRNKRRVIRAIEANGQKPKKKSLRENTLILGVKRSKDDLKQRITNRVDDMLSQGLEAEVKALSLELDWDTEAMKGIGYREWQPYFEGTQSLEQTRQRIISATMGLAKRQRTWFKRNKSVHWIEGVEEAKMLVGAHLNNHLLQ